MQSILGKRGKQAIVMFGRDFLRNKYFSNVILEIYLESLETDHISVKDSALFSGSFIDQQNIFPIHLNKETQMLSGLEHWNSTCGYELKSIFHYNF